MAGAAHSKDGQGGQALAGQPSSAHCPAEHSDLLRIIQTQLDRTSSVVNVVHKDVKKLDELLDRVKFLEHEMHQVKMHVSAGQYYHDSRGKCTIPDCAKHQGAWGIPSHPAASGFSRLDYMGPPPTSGYPMQALGPHPLGMYHHPMTGQPNWVPMGPQGFREGMPPPYSWQQYPEADWGQGPMPPPSAPHTPPGNFTPHQEKKGQVHLGQFSSNNGGDTFVGEVQTGQQPMTAAPAGGLSTPATPVILHTILGSQGSERQPDEFLPFTSGAEPLQSADLSSAHLTSQELPAQVEGPSLTLMASEPVPEAGHMEPVPLDEPAKAGASNLASNMATLPGEASHLVDEEAICEPTNTVTTHAAEPHPNVEVVRAEEAHEQQGVQEDINISDAEVQNGTPAPTLGMAGATLAQHLVPITNQEGNRENFILHGDNGAVSPAAVVVDSVADKAVSFSHAVHTQSVLPAAVAASHSTTGHSNAEEVAQTTCTTSTAEAQGAADLTLRPTELQSSGAITPSLSRFGSAQLPSNAEHRVGHFQDSPDGGSSAQLASDSQGDEAVEETAPPDSQSSIADAVETRGGSRRRRPRGGRKRGGRGRNRDPGPASDIASGTDGVATNSGDAIAQPAAAAAIVQPVSSSTSHATGTQRAPQRHRNGGNGGSSGGGQDRGRGSRASGNSRATGRGQGPVSSSAPPTGAGIGSSRPSRQQQPGNDDGARQQGAACLQAMADISRAQPDRPLRGRGGEGPSAGQPGAAPQAPLGNTAARQSTDLRQRAGAGSGNGQQPAASRPSAGAASGSATQPASSRPGGGAGADNSTQTSAKSRVEYFDNAMVPAFPVSRSYGTFLDMASRAKDLPVTFR